MRRGLRTAIGNERPVEQDAATEATRKEQVEAVGRWTEIVILSIAAFGLLALVIGAMGASIHWWVVVTGR